MFNVQDITERKAAADALRRSNVELRQYAGVAAHELQEPLRLISSYTQLLARRYRGKLDSDADEFIDFASGAADRLQRMLAALLVYSQIGSADSQTQAVDCNALWFEVKGQLHERIRDAGAHIEQDALPHLNGDRHELSQLFLHLLTNALDNAAGKTPRIHIGARPAGEGWWQLSVSDQGVGIAPRYHENIFRLFARLQGPTEGKGTGVGLALCRKVVERYGGRIWVESEEGKGACFHFTLPAARSSAPVAGLS